MQIEILKSKVHRVIVTEANLNYVGSLTLDEDLMDAANMIENEKITVVNANNGERLETYLIKGKRGSGICCLNGPVMLWWLSHMHQWILKKQRNLNQL